MSRTDYPNALAQALDRFETPPLSTGFADRVMAGAQAPTLSPYAAPRRDRRGLWRRGRQILIGTVAFGMMSAAAVASGLLGAAGIEVPVLSAMLAPKPVQTAKPAVARKPVERLARVEPAPSAALPVPVAEAAPAPASWREIVQARRAALRANRRAERQAFIDAHPGMREAIAGGPAARRDYLLKNPDVMLDVQAHAAANRAAMIGQRRNWIKDPAVQARLQAMSPDERAAFIEARRARFQAMREQRRARWSAQRNQGEDTSGEGSAAPAR